MLLCQYVNYLHLRVIKVNLLLQHKVVWRVFKSPCLKHTLHYFTCCSPLPLSNFRIQTGTKFRSSIPALNGLNLLGIKYFLMDYKLSIVFRNCFFFWTVRIGILWWMAKPCNIYVVDSLFSTCRKANYLPSTSGPDLYGKYLWDSNVLGITRLVYIASVPTTTFGIILTGCCRKHEKWKEW